MRPPGDSQKFGRLVDREQSRQVSVFVFTTDLIRRDRSFRGCTRDA